LLHEVADHDERDQVERLQLAELAPSDEPAVPPPANGSARAACPS
jgi:hypothetical protein